MPQTRSIREKLYRAYIRRASEGEQNNEKNIVKVRRHTISSSKCPAYVCRVVLTLEWVVLDLICLGSMRFIIGHACQLNHACLTRYCVDQILSLKKEMANLLGFKNYAELSLASKMVSRPLAHLWLP
jgi:Zn-dependent oligopeptidase